MGENTRRFMREAGITTVAQIRAQTTPCPDIGGERYAHVPRDSVLGKILELPSVVEPGRTQAQSLAVRFVDDESTCYFVPQYLVDQLLEEIAAWLVRIPLGEEGTAAADGATIYRVSTGSTSEMRHLKRG